MAITEDAPQAQLFSDIEDSDFSQPLTETNGRGLPEIDIVRLRSNDWRLHGGVQLSQAIQRLCDTESVVIAPESAVSVCRTILLAAGFGWVGFSRHISGAGMVDIEDGDDPSEIAAQDQRVRDTVKAQNAIWDAHYDERFGIKKPKDPKAAERQRKRRAKLKAERDAAKNVTPDTVTTEQTVTPDRDGSLKCHDESVTLSPNVTEDQSALAF